MRTSNSVIFTPEEFLYLKSVFSIKDARTYESGSNWFSGDLFGESVMSESFEKEKYTL
jgi:hypothetical protein